jgi:hypothetical protein
MKPKVFPIDKSQYALLAGRCGAAVFELRDDGEVWASGIHGPMDEEIAEALAVGAAGARTLAEALERNRLSDPRAECFIELGHLLFAVGVVRCHSDLARLCGLSTQRVYQLMSDPTSMPSKAAMDRLRESLAGLKIPCRKAMAELADCIASRARSKLGSLYERGS